jgi:hypothetical protein
MFGEKGVEVACLQPRQGYALSQYAFKACRIWAGYLLYQRSMTLFHRFGQTWARRGNHSEADLFSMSGSFHVLWNNGFSGPYRRNITSNPPLLFVDTQFDSPSGQSKHRPTRRRSS